MSSDIREQSRDAMGKAAFEFFLGSLVHAPYEWDYLLPEDKQFWADLVDAGMAAYTEKRLKLIDEQIIYMNGGTK